MRKTKTTGIRKQKVKTYEAYLLGIALVVMIVGETALISNSTAADWHAGLSVLDMSPSISQTVSDMKVAFAPVAFTVNSINEFYQASALASAQILDMSSSSPDQPSPGEFVYGVNNFYQMAANEMTNVLDLSNYMPSTSSAPRVAGISITR